MPALNIRLHLLTNIFMELSRLGQGFNTLMLSFLIVTPQHGHRLSAGVTFYGIKLSQMAADP